MYDSQSSSSDYGKHIVFAWAKKAVCMRVKHKKGGVMAYFTNDTETVKLCVMYMLKTMNGHLTLPQLITSVTEATGMRYFDVQLAIAELEDRGMLASSPSAAGTEYSVTSSGHETLVAMVKSLPASIRSSCDRYVAENRKKIMELGFFSTNSCKNPSGGVDVTLTSIEKDRTIISLTINVTDQKTADSICSSWEKKCSDVYSSVFSILTED